MTLTLVTTLVVLLAIAGMVGFVARRIGIPYPVLLVVVGLLLALIPHLPAVRADPDLIPSSSSSCHPSSTAVPSTPRSGN